MRPDADLETRGNRFFAKLEHPLACGAVHRCRLLHEDVELLGDRVLEVNPPECRRGSENNDIAGLSRSIACL